MLPLWSGWTAELCQQAAAMAQLPAATLPVLASFALVVLLQAALAFALSLLPPIATVNSLCVKSGSMSFAPLEWLRLRRQSDHTSLGTVTKPCCMCATHRLCTSTGLPGKRPPPPQQQQRCSGRSRMRPPSSAFALR